MFSEFFQLNIFQFKVKNSFKNFKNVHFFGEFGRKYPKFRLIWLTVNYFFNRFNHLELLNR